jgi:hypothetical protein
MADMKEPLWAELQKAGVVHGPPPEKDGEGSPWYVKVLLAVSGWLAAVFLLCFIGAGFHFVFDSKGAAFVTGAVLVAVSYALIRSSHNEFTENLALAVSLAGQGLIIFSIFDHSKADDARAWGLVTGMNLFLAAAMPHFVHRVLSSFFGSMTGAVALTLMGGYHGLGGILLLMAVLCWLHEFRWPGRILMIRAWGYGVVLGLIVVKGTTLFGYQSLEWLFWRIDPVFLIGWRAGELLVGAAALFAGASLLARYRRGVADRVSVTVIVGTLFLCAVSMKVQGVTVGMVILMLGFYGSNRVLTGLGIVSLLFYISTYYYLLDTTLWVKSESLFGVGAVLLLFRWLMPRILPTGGEVAHD